MSNVFNNTDVMPEEDANGQMKELLCLCIDKIYDNTATKEQVLDGLVLVVQYLLHTSALVTLEEVFPFMSEGTRQFNTTNGNEFKSWFFVAHSKMQQHMNVLAANATNNMSLIVERLREDHDIKLF